MESHLTIASETQNYETVPFVSGIQRVVRQAHIGLTDRLTPRGIGLVPLHSRSIPRRVDLPTDPALDQDPVLELRPRDPNEVDAFLFLDVNMNVDFSAIFASVRGRERPVIALVHDVIPLKDLRVFDDRVRADFRMYLQQLLHLADHVIVTSEHTRDDLRDLGWRIDAEIHVIPLGSVFRQRPPAASAEDKISILYVSTLESRKGHRDLIEAFDLLLDDGHDVDLTLIGRVGWNVPGAFHAVQFLKQLRDHPHFGGRLRWMQDADDLTMRTIARSCNIGVFPSRDEGFGLFIEEGLALGLKMVASDIPVFREREQPNLTFSAAGGRAFAQAILDAHQVPWHPPMNPVRTMDDFVDELADLLIDIVVS